MTLVDPFWLVLAVPLVMALWRWRLPSRLLMGLRVAASLLLMLGLCGLSVLLPTRCGTVVVVADRSLSMPSDGPSLQKEAADLIHSAMPPGDRLAVVSFAETVAVEQSPQASKFTGFSADVGSEASHLADALDVALSMIGPDRPGRVLVLSDGQWTGRDVAGPAARAAAAGVAVDYRTIERPRAGDLAIQSVQGPESALPGESFMITAWLDSPVAQTVAYELRRGSQVIAQGSQTVPSGTSRLIFRDTAASQGVCDYEVRARGQGPDPVPENNRARLLVGVRGAKPLLAVSPSGSGGLGRLLAKSGMSVRAAAAPQCTWSLEELAGYSAVLLENTQAGLVGHVGMQNLAAWVTQGGGLMLTGGRDSYGPGGYYRSPLEPILPVSMELRREHRKFSLAIVVALDRSGSMAMPVPGGRTKIELADLATAEVVETLGPMDQFGCLAVDSMVHEIVPLAEVTAKGAIRSKILRIDSAGGGIFIYEALAAAARMIAPATAGTKHILLFADASDSEQPGAYKTLVDKCVKAGITISVIGLGTERDCDAPLLKDIARRGGGQCMFTNVAQELPRLFAQDTFLVARNAFLSEPVQVQPTGGLLSLIGQSLGEFPAIGGYNLCYLRREANLGVVTTDEYQAPVVASWQAGLGRVLCYTGEADGQYTGAIARWPNAGEFFTSLARWTAGKSQGLGPHVVATQELRNGVCRVELHLDPERKEPPFSLLPELATLAARPGEPAMRSRTRMHWASADRLLAEIPLTGGQTTLSSVVVPGVGQIGLAPMCLPYSPEYRPQRRRDDVGALEYLARLTGGCERLNLAAVWKDVPRRPQWVSLAPWLLLAAVVLFLLEVVQRRTGLLSLRWEPFGRLSEKTARRVGAWFGSRRKRAAPPGAIPASDGTSPESGRVRARTHQGTQDAQGQPAGAGGPVAPAAAPSGRADSGPGPSDKPAQGTGEASMLDALARAQQRARNRTGRDS